MSVGAEIVTFARDLQTISQRIMKQAIIFALAAAMAVAVSCSGGQADRTARQETESENKQEVKKGSEMVTEMTTQMFKDRIMDYEEQQKEWIYKGQRPAVIDFYATWCGPCKATAPVVAALAEQYDGQVDFYKVDVDQQEELATVFGIRSIPTLLFIPVKGNPQMQVGAMNRQQMEQAVSGIMGN